MTTKKQVATLLILMLVGMMGLVNAQTSSTIKAQVPFNFVANSKTLAAGECEIEVVGNGIQWALSISSGKQHVYAFPIPEQPLSTTKKSALVFHRYGDQYFLAAIKREGRNSYKLPTGKLELELRAQNVTEQDFTLLASAK